MSDRDPNGKVDVGNMLAGLFLSCFGLFALLLGGGCGLMLLPTLGSDFDSEMGLFLLIAIAIFGGGCAALYHGVRLLSGRE